MVLTEKTVEEILNYLDNSIAKLASDTLITNEFQMGNDELEQFLASQYDIRLDNLLQRKNSNIHHLESGLKNKTLQRKHILLDRLLNDSRV